LTELMRQKDDGSDPDQTMFIALLADLRDGYCSREQYDWLMTKTPDNIGPERMADFEKCATYLQSVNKSVDSRNARKLKECGTSIFKMSAQNSSATGKGSSADRFRGLENTSFLSLECLVLISTNIWKAVGLVNGQPATVKDVVYLEGQVPNKDLPAFIVVECPNYVGPPFFTEKKKKKWVPIVPSKFHDDSFKESRTGNALRLAYAMTIQKSQGESLAMICVDIGNITPINSQGRRNSRLG
jgi:hypothetical protein